MTLTTRAIVLLASVAVLLLLGAVWGPLQWLGLVYFGFCLLLLLLDWRAAEPVSRFDVARLHDGKLSLGADNTVQLRVRNRSQQPTSVQLRDEPPDRFHSSTLLHQFELAPRGTWNSSYTVKPLRRGDYQFGQLTLRWLGPLGLLTRQAAVPAIETRDGIVTEPVAVKVYPNLLDVRRYDLMLRRNRLQELGLRNTRQAGDGSEYERLREYTPDDDFRRIDWKATARRNRPVTVQYQTERSQNIFALIDTGRMMQSPVEDIAKIDYVINAVLLLSYVATGLGDKVGLMGFADEVGRYLAPKAGRSQFYRMLEALYAVEPQPVEPDYAHAFSYLALKQRKRALMLIFTDLSGGASMQSLVKHAGLLAKRSLPVVVTLNDPAVLAAAENRPVDSDGVYRQAAARQLLDQRRQALDQLHRQGVLTLDVSADELSIAVINRYLELKLRQKI